MLSLASVLGPALLLLRPSYKQLVGGGGGRLPLDRSVDALLQLPEQSAARSSGCRRSRTWGV